MRWPWEAEKMTQYSSHKLCFQVSMELKGRENWGGTEMNALLSRPDHGVG